MLADIIEAIDHANLPLLRRLLSNHSHALMLKESAITSKLFELTQAKNEFMVWSLLELGVDPNAVDEKGNCFLHYAIYSKLSVGILAFAVLKNAQINQQNHAGVTALHVAVDINYKDAVQFLLAKQADFHKTTKSGVTPLHLAVVRNAPEIAGCLLAYGANPNTPDHHGYTPFHYALGKRFATSVMEKFLSYPVDIHSALPDGKYPIHQAAEAGIVEHLDLLRRQGANLHVLLDGCSAVDLAAMYGKAAAVTFLEQHGVTSAQPLPPFPLQGQTSRQWQEKILPFSRSLMPKNSAEAPLPIGRGH